MLGIQRCAAGRVRRNDRGLADLIGHGQLRAELTRLAGDLHAVLAGGDGALQCANALLKPGFLRLVRHRRDQALQHLGKFELFAVFGFIDNVAGLDRLRVIGTNVVEQMQRLRRTFHSVGQQI
ncbi:hypothetical protein D3C73_1048030 [compost metagenome]